MRWMKHMTASWDDERMAKLVDQAPGRNPDRGLAAYGLYWRVQEIIAATMEGGDPSCSAQYHVSRWASLLGLRASDVQRQLNGLAVAGLSLVDRIDMDIRVTNRNLLKYRDEYSRKSGHAPDNVAPDTEAEAEVEQIHIKKEQKTSRAKRAVDPRHTPFRDALSAYWRHKNSNADEIPWNGRDAKALSELLAASPNLTLEQFRELLRHRARSQVAHGDRVYLWIAKVHSYTEPLNEFNRPGGSNGKHSGLQSPAIERQHRNFDNLKQAMVDSGDYPPGYVNGQDSRLLPEPGAEHGDLPGIPGSAKRDRH